MDVLRLRSLFVVDPLRETAGVPDFRTDEEKTRAETQEASDAENAFKNFFKHWPRFYDRLALTVAPILFTGLTGEKFARRLSDDALLLNVGSGPTRLHPNSVNVDLFPFRNVDVLTVAERLPFTDASFDAIVCDQVLEHVEDPQAVIREMTRVLKTGGSVYIGVPFIYPLHPSPKDYARWSADGVASLLPGFEIAESGPAMGPTSGLLTVLADWLALAFSFGLQPLRKGLRYVFMLLLFPFKYLDLLFAHYPGAETIAATVYLVAKKR
jgi:SAM-dependent methyltransferase